MSVSPVRVPLLDLKAQHETIRGDIAAALSRVVESQHFILGPEVEHLEREIEAYSGVAHAIGVSSGTDAILLALMALGVGPGDEIVTTPYTFIATCSCIARRPRCACACSSPEARGPVMQARRRREPQEQ